MYFVPLGPRELSVIEKLLLRHVTMEAKFLDLKLWLPW